MAWFVKPETVRVDLPEGQWVEIKQQLSYGDMQSVASKTRGDYTAGALFFVAAAIVDWSLTDQQDKRVPVDTDAQKVDALKALTQQAFASIDTAITKHYDKVAEEKKGKAPRGVKRSARTSASAA